jgi:hypothetical protein
VPLFVHPETAPPHPLRASTRLWRTLPPRRGRRDGVPVLFRVLLIRACHFIFSRLPPLFTLYSHVDQFTISFPKAQMVQCSVTHLFCITCVKVYASTERASSSASLLACTSRVQEVSLLRAEALPGGMHSSREDLFHAGLRCMRSSVGSWARVRCDPAHLPHMIYLIIFLMHIISEFLQRPSASPGFFVLCCTPLSHLRPLTSFPALG